MHKSLECMDVRACDMSLFRAIRPRVRDADLGKIIIRKFRDLFHRFLGLFGHAGDEDILLSPRDHGTDDARRLFRRLALTEDDLRHALPQTAMVKQ